MSLYVIDTRVILCNNEHVIIFNVTDKVENVINLPLVENTSKNINSSLDVDNSHMITHLSFSKCGTYFSVCTNRKQLCLYNLKTLELISNRILHKAASKVCFTLDNDIVVADRAGDVYLFSTKFPNESGTFMLGHVSMLLDVLVTDDGKYIITADRDEKIRVSMYPNAYNIANYCLGHVKFVTNISQLSHDKDILISAGGDGTFLLWDYKTGKEIASVNFTEKLFQTDISNFNNVLKDSNFDEIIQNLPVKHLRVSLYGTSSLVLISFYSSQTILIYEISGNVNSKCTPRYIQSIISDKEPLDCFMKNQHLWILSDSGVRAYEFKDSEFSLDHSFDDELKKLNHTWNKLTNNLLKQNLFHILYRKKFDNVQEYLERKKLRLTNVTE